MTREFDSLNAGLCQFLQAAPTPFHAVSEMSRELLAAGFIELEEGESWQLEAGKAYFITRNGSSLVALRTGNGALVETGLRMAGAHTDSPCLKVKPQPETVRHGYAQLGVEVYGGVLLNPWFDRDLSLAGRVHYLDKQGDLKSALLDFKRAVATIPSLAIHLDREANQNRSINPQKDLPPLVLQVENAEQYDFRQLLLEQLQAQGLADVSRVLDYEISLYDVQPPAVVGLNKDFIASARLDNLLSCYVGLQALLNMDDGRPSLLVCNDHEEVGSESSAGAHGPFLTAVLERLCEQLGGSGQENFRRMLDHSLMISADNAHGIHPNFADKHDARHGPILNQGPVIKINANQRYATNSETSAMFRSLCEQAQVPVQAFVVRSDMGCGSTIGPIVATELGIRTLDVGVPTFAMHSIRELAGVRDAFYLYSVLKDYFSNAS